MAVVPVTPPALLLVHAHPDDEVTTTGLTMARAADHGARVTLVTCTLGEEGDVVVEDLAHLAAHADDSLGRHRVIELDAAMRHLGVTDYRRLGHDGKYRDSGMALNEQGRPIPVDTVHPEAFWRADLRAAATDLVPIIRDRRPDVLITYDDYGNYGHPDHIQAHRVAMYASQLAAVDSYRPDLGVAWQVRRVLWPTTPETYFREGIRQLRAAGHTTHWARFDPDGPMPPMVWPDATVAVKVSAPELVDRKLAAFRAHASQIAADSPFFRMAELFGPEAWGTEWFRFAGGVPVPAGATDIFAGL